ncbi:hypothetical protein ACET3Z_013519 [Daucus carota]
MKETKSEKPEKSTEKLVDGDEEGQGKLYSPEFAVKINTRQQQDAHKQGTEEMGQKMNKEASGGKEEKPAKKTIASKL